MSNLIRSLGELADLSKVWHRNGLTIGLCHGCFDIVHLGHVHHFRQARTNVDVLCVSVTADKYVNKGVGRPVFSDVARAKFLLAIRYCDYVVINKSATAEQIISAIKPSIFFKGNDYGAIVDERIVAEKKVVEAQGGQVVFTNAEVVDSTTRIARIILSENGSRG